MTHVSPVNADTERREFEAWFSTIASGRYADWLKRWDNGNGDYYYTEARTAWAAWSARALIRAQCVPSVQLQARKIGQGEWIDIFPAQVEWMSKEGYNLRAKEAPALTSPGCKS